MFAYDASGNRSSLTEDAVLYSYSNLASTNQLLSTSGPQPKTYSYDLAGNVTSDGVHTYGYDDRGRLIDVDAGAATYTYNGQGQRVSKTSGTTTLFAYGEVGELLGEYDASGNAMQETVWFNGAPVALLEGTSTYYVHSDHLGTPRVISDGNTAIWRWASDPFGSTLPDEDPDNDGTTLTYNVRFPGQYYDAETGLHYNYFRTYDPSTGRYLESDPIGLRGGLNTFGYANQSPSQYVDPLGLDTFSFQTNIGFPSFLVSSPNLSILMRRDSLVFMLVSLLKFHGVLIRVRDGILPAFLGVTGDSTWEWVRRLSPLGTALKASRHCGMIQQRLMPFSVVGSLEYNSMRIRASIAVCTPGLA